MIKAENTPTTHERADATRWEALQASIGAKHALYLSTLGLTDTPENEEALAAALDAYDDAIEAAMAMPAPDSAAASWKLQFLAEQFEGDHVWDGLEALVPRVLRDALRFVAATDIPPPVRP